MIVIIALIIEIICIWKYIALYSWVILWLILRIRLFLFTIYCVIQTRLISRIVIIFLCTMILYLFKSFISCRRYHSMHNLILLIYVVVLVKIIFWIGSKISKNLVDLFVFFLINVDIFGCLDLSVVVYRKNHIID